jgi:hypothetical protein
MFKKNYTANEVKERMEIFFPELVNQCKKYECFEFEYYWEMWGAMWMPWFLEIDGNSSSFTANDIGGEDFVFLIKNGYIKLIKEYEQGADKDQFDRKRYKVIKNC